MAVANALIDELGKITKQARDLVTEFEGKQMPAEKRGEFEKLHARALEIKASIDADQANEEKQKDFGQIADWLRRPQHTRPLPTGAEGASEGRKVLTDRGWEFKGGVWHAATSRGLYPMYAEEVLFGETPSNLSGEESAYFRTARVALQPMYGKVFNKWIMNTGKLKDQAMAFSQLEGWEQKALSEGADSAGGFLVPPDYQAELLVRKAATAVVRQAGATVQATSRDTLRYPMALAAAATAGGLASGGDSIFSSGFVGSWAGETPAFTDVDPKFGLFGVSVKKVRVATKLGNDFIADSAVEIVAWMARNGGQNMALVEDLGFLSGDGAALQPKGITNNGAAGTNIAGTTANTISNTSANAGSAPKLITLVYKLPPQYTANAKIIASRGSEGAIRGLVDAQNRPLWPELAGSGLVQGSPTAILGFPRLNSQFLVDGSVANAGAVALILGDFSAYVIAERAQISTVILRERFADTDQTGIILFERVGGDTWNTDAFRFGTL